MSRKPSRKTEPSMPSKPAIVDCWNRIGVHGDGSCPEVRVHVHCRNCPVYSAAAVQLLDREHVAYGLDAATRLYAADKVGEQRQERSAFLFRVCGEWLALETGVLDEVADLRAIHSLPHKRNGVVLGLANVRGELLVCVSLAQLLGIDPMAETQAARHQRIALRRLLVVRREGTRLAFPVDEVHGTRRFDDHELKPVPATVAKAGACYSKAMLSWQGHAVGLIDDELLFHSLNRSLA
jgi:chemotaxis-related protein WspD